MNGIIIMLYFSDDASGVQSSSSIAAGVECTNVPVAGRPPNDASVVDNGSPSLTAFAMYGLLTSAVIIIFIV